jgi:hypothetical protein
MTQRRSFTLPADTSLGLLARTATMKKLATMLTLAVLGLVLAPVWADDVPHMDFVRALRAKNYNDLALDYLSRMENDKSVPADIKAAIPLEKARTRMDQATNEFNPAKRQALYDQARGEFDAFAKAKPNDPYAAEAKFESARILSLKGRSQLSKVRTAEEGAAQAEYQKAYDLFVQAGRELKAAFAKLKEVEGGNLPPRVEAAIKAARMQCALEIQIAVIEQACTYEALNKNLEERGQLIKDAIIELKKLHGEDAKSPVCWMAKAWNGKAFLELDQPKEAENEFKVVLAENGQYAERAQRASRFFAFHDAVDARKRKKSDEIIKLADEWIKLYPSHLKTSEGVFIRFELAKTYENMAKGMMKDPKAAPDAKAKEYLEKAEALYSALDEIETEFGDEPGQRKLAVTMLKVGNVDVANVKTIDKFDQAYSVKQSMLAKLQTTEKADERKAMMKKVLDVLQRACDLIDSKVPDAKAAEVRGELAYAYMANGDPFKAVVLGEHLAHSMPNVPKAAAGGAYALQAYAQMVGDPAAEAKSIAVDTERMHRLALYMEKTFPTDPNTDAARHVVGTLLLRPPSPNPKEAAAILSRVSDGYKPKAALTDARWWWADACKKMLADKNLADKDKTFYQAQVVKALEGIPEIANDAPSETTTMYVWAKVDLGQVFFENKKYDQMESLALTLQKRLPLFKNLDANARKDLGRTVESLVFYAQYGRAAAELKAGKVAEARKLADPILSRITDQVASLKTEEAEARKVMEAKEAGIKFAKDKEKAQAEAEEAKERYERVSRNLNQNVQLMRGLMIVALQAAILEENSSRCMQLLGSLQKSAGDASVGTSVYVQIVQEIHKHITELKAGGPAKKAQLDKTVASFMAFLDTVAKKQLTPEIIFFLANAYSSLDKHAEAGALLAKIPAPDKNADDKAHQMYKAAQFMSLRELRLGKQYDAALKMLNQILKTEWGPKSHQIDEEKAALFTDWGKFGAAAVAWKDLMAKLLPDVQKKPKVKEAYYDAYYHYINCLYKYGQSLDDPKKKQDYIDRAAKAIVKLSETQPDYGGEGMKEKYDKLLNDEPTLKKAVQAAKQAAANAPAASSK